MRETIKYIGRWVIRFILMSIIFSTFQSCAKAVTNVPQTLVDEINTNIEKVANYYDINHYPVYTRNNIQKDSSNLYCIFITDSTSPWNPNTIGAFFPQYDTLTTTYNGSQFLNNIRTTLTNISTNQQVGVSDWSLTKNAVFKYMYTQFNWANNTNHAYVADHEYGADIILRPPFTYYFGNMHTKEITYSGESVLANTLSYNYRLAPIVNVVCEDTIITSMHAILNDIELRCNDLGSYWNLTYNNSTMFKYNQLYNLRVDSVIEGNIETLEAKILFVPPGTVIENNTIVSTPSGDFSFNTENATNQIIDNQNQNQEDNQSFLDNLYNQMFTVSGEQVQQIVNTTMSNVQIPSGEIAEIKQIFNYLSGDAGDFVISWTDKTTHFTVNGTNISQMTIPARQINFSEMERQSPELQQAMHWARLITNISIFSILIHEAYICLLTTLGVPVAIYGQKLEEKAQLQAQQQKQEQAWQNRLEQQRYNEWLYSHRKR